MGKKKKKTPKQYFQTWLLNIWLPICKSNFKDAKVGCVLQLLNPHKSQCSQWESVSLKNRALSNGLYFKMFFYIIQRSFICLCL